MEEIKINDYVRTKQGTIARITEIAIDDEDTLYFTGKYKCYYHNDIVKHSKNIIDLIEIGDYVNGKYVKEINKYKDGKSIIALIGIINESEIKTILTKEKFESKCYKVEEK